jgi:hypothetical protein
MQRFLMLVGAAAVAAAMYVTGSPASQQSRGPTEKQFLALQKRVTTLSKTLETVKTEADAAAGIIGACYLHENANSTFSFTVMPVSQLGSPSEGFLYGTSVSSTPRTALDIATSSPQAYLQEVDPTCATLSALTHAAIRTGSSRLQRWAQRTR